MYSSGDRRSGFTIIELLVVMGISAVLTGISFAAIRAMQSPRDDALVCTLHLQLIGRALKAYHLDYGQVPRELSVFTDSTLILGYIRDPMTMRCPADENEGDTLDSYEDEYHWTLDIPEGDPDEHMQLSLAEPRRWWYPDDSAVITRCNRHENELVLTWSGDVESITAD